MFNNTLLRKSYSRFFSLTIIWSVALFCLSGCSRDLPIKVHPAFYYWKTIFQLNDQDEEYFKSLGVENLYVRFFDLSWNNRIAAPLPSNEIILSKNSWLPEQIVPVVYITQETIKNIKEENLGFISMRILKETQRIARKMNIASFSEIQIDCDWTPKNRDKYFGLLKDIEKEKSRISPSLIISATIRLHQVKYSREAGVPPVEKGVLMVYHTSSPMVLQDQSTIFNLGESKNYLRGLEQYPLKLDVALPNFSWVVQFNQHEKFIRILYVPNGNSLDQNPLMNKIGQYVYKASVDTFLGDRRIMEGDFLKLDKADPSDVLECIKFLRKRINNSEINLILFDYDGLIPKGSNDETEKYIKKVFDF